MKKVLTIFLALFMVLSLSGAAIAATPDTAFTDITYNGGNEYWNITISPAGLTLGENGVTGTVTINGTWVPSKTLSIVAPSTLKMNLTENPTVNYNVDVFCERISAAGDYFSESTVSGQFTVDPEGLMKKNVKIGTWTGSLTFTLNIDEATPVVTPGTLEELNAAFAAAAKDENGDVVINLNQDFDAENNWRAYAPEGYNGVNHITVNGNGHTIYHLNEPLMVGAFGGAGYVTIRDLTIEKATINQAKYNDLGLGAFIAYVDASGGFTLTNCRLNDSIVTCTDGYAGGLIGYSSSKSNSVTKCSVTNCQITGANSVGAIIGHTQLGTTGSYTDCTITNNQLTSTKNSDWRVGVVAGTITGEGTATISNIDATNNTLSQPQATTTKPAGQSDLYGRVVPTDSDNTVKVTIDS